MEYWNKLLHTAMLGTGKLPVQQEDVPDGLVDAVDLISRQAKDSEDHFLQAASLALNYKKSGELPIRHQPGFPQAAAEEKEYCGQAAQQALDGILQTANMPLLTFWLRKCAQAGQILPSEKLPLLFELTLKQKSAQQLLAICGGKRGEWLKGLNKAWNDLAEQDENSWHTGTPDQRIGYLHLLRKADPAKARELLQETWPQENANTRAALLIQMQPGIGDEDIPWLEQATKDKSQKVKAEAMRLLKLIPGSVPVQQNWDVIRRSVSIKENKGILGFGKGITLEVQLARPIDENIFKNGIEKLSSSKDVSDDDLILYQLITTVPPSFFEKQYGLNREEIIEVFSKSKHAKQFIPAFAAAAITFRDKEWLKIITRRQDCSFHEQALYLLDSKDADRYALRFLEVPETAQLVITAASGFPDQGWSKELTRGILKFTASRPYLYTRHFYSNTVYAYPEDIVAELETFTPSAAYEKEAWTRTSEYIIQLLTLKIQTLKAFQIQS